MSKKEFSSSEDKFLSFPVWEELHILILQIYVKFYEIHTLLWIFMHYFFLTFAHYTFAENGR